MKFLATLLSLGLTAALSSQVVLDHGPDKGPFQSRDELVPEDAMEIRGMGNALRELTPVLKRSYERVAFVDAEELYRRQIAAIETGSVPDTPLPVVRREGRAIEQPATRSVDRSKTDDATENSSWAWTITVILLLVGMLVLLIRHVRT